MTSRSTARQTCSARRGGWIGGHCARPKRIRREVLHGRGQLGCGGPQHTHILHSRCHPLPQLHPLPEEKPPDASEGHERDVGLLLAASRIDASDDVPLLGQGNAPRVPIHERLWLPHLQARQFRGRTGLLQISLQDEPGNQVPLCCRCNQTSWGGPRFLHS
ncbi:hypothetical protein PMAYCL1PPCAC_16128, partial [Pristionchus mayeri]